MSDNFGIAHRLDVTKLLTNEEHINDDDHDFQHILALLRHSCEYDIDTVTSSHLLQPKGTSNFITLIPAQNSANLRETAQLPGINDVLNSSVKTETNDEYTQAPIGQLNMASFQTKQYSEIRIPLYQISNVPCGGKPNITQEFKRKETFPIQLFEILEKSDAFGYSSIVSWLPHGRAFKIYNEELFFKNIIRKHFRQTEFKSFKHQLYVYGFKKIGKRFTDSGAYYHDSFIRGRLDLCRSMSTVKEYV